MRIARYRSGAQEKVGIVRGESVVALNALDAHLAPDPAALLAAGPTAWKELASAAEESEGTPISEVELLAPVRPSKFLAVGMNSEDHMREAQEAPQTPELLAMVKATEHIRAAFPDPRFPLLFNKQTNSVTGPHDPIWIPSGSDQVDYEGEAVVVIGRRVRCADEDEAGEAIGGWTVTNDVSVRDWQWNTSQIWLGKSYDTHGPIGPWVVTADEFDPAAAMIRTWVNGEQRQDGRLADQILSPARIVSLISQVCTLEPGDLVATGTPGGIGSLFGRFLVPGDRVRIEVTGIGSIENPVIAEPNGDRPSVRKEDRA